MLCEKCKIREANVLFTEILNDVKREHHYCMQCAKDLDFGPRTIFEGDFPLAKLLSGLLSETIHDKNKAFAQIVCPNCKTSYEDFISDSRFGCKECYEVFGILIESNIRQLQGSDTHKGKHPKMVPPSRKGQENALNSADDAEQMENRQELQRLLQAAIESEDFENAAKYRDRIKKLGKGDEHVV